MRRKGEKAQQKTQKTQTILFANGGYDIELVGETPRLPMTCTVQQKWWYETLLPPVPYFQCTPRGDILPSG